MAWSQIPTFIKDPDDLRHPDVRAGRRPPRVILNPAKPFVQPFELEMDEPNQVVSVSPGETAGPFPLSARFDGPLEIFYIKAVVSDSSGVPLTDYDVTWLLEHPGKRKVFMNRFIPLIACAGDGGRPYVLPETIFLPSTQSLQVRFTNNDSAPRQIELALGCIKYYPNTAPGKIAREMWEYIERRERTYAYWQTTDREVIIPANGNADRQTFTIPDDADLEVFKLTAQSTGPFRARIRDGQTDRALTSTRVHSSLLFGGHDPTALSSVGGSGGLFPARWPTTWLVRRSVQGQIDFTDLSGATNTVRIVLGGRKISYA